MRAWDDEERKRKVREWAVAKGPYTYSAVYAKACDGGTHFRIADPDDNRIASCWDEVNASMICQALNRVWLAQLQTPTIDIIRAGVRLNGRAAKTTKAKTGGTRKRRAAKRDKGTADVRAVAGSTPTPGFLKLRNVRYYQ